jgi:hypothetical protein
MRRYVNVIWRGAQWAVTIEGGEGPMGVFNSQEEALEAAGQLARRHDDQIAISDGSSERAATR